ncbi:MAG: tetratricopeptide repeat protein, partial [Bryobacteraceae bacterium]|nr:tetratricopeptide repeat protein [Bryobacteraceae bacterium]
MYRVTLAILSLAVILLTGCDGPPEKARLKYLESGNKYFSNGKFREASIMYRRSLQKDMRFAEAHYRLGLSELRLGRIVDAMRAFQRAVELDPKNIDAPAKLADIYLAAYAQDPRRPQQFLKEIEDLAKRLTDRDPNSYDGLRLNGYLALAKNKPEEGVALFERANKVKPNQNETVIVLIQSLIATNRWTEAEKLAKETVARDKTYTPPYDILYAKYMQEKREEEAEQILKLKADNNPRSVEFTQQLAAHYFIKSRRPDMLAALDRLIKNPKDFPQGRLAVGQFYFRIREFDNAVEQFNKGIQETPRDKALYQRRLVETMVMQGKKTEATQLVEQILKADPKDNEALAMRASLMLQSGSKDQIQAAVNDLQSVVSRMPENAVVRFNLARALIAKNDLDAAKV